MPHVDKRETYLLLNIVQIKIKNKQVKKTMNPLYQSWFKVPE